MNDNQTLLRNPSYLQNFEGIRDGFSFDELIRFFHLFNKNPCASLLDAMCGTGFAGNLLDQNFSSIRQLGFLDTSPEMLAAVESKGEKYCLDVCEMLFSDSEWNSIVCRLGLNNLAEEQYPFALRELLRVLSFDGVLLVQDHFQTFGKMNTIDLFEKAIASYEGRSAAPFSPTLARFSDLVDSAGGRIIGHSSFLKFFDLTQRFIAKGFSAKDVDHFLKTCTIIRPPEKIVDEHYFYLYPITTIAIVVR